MERRNSKEWINSLKIAIINEDFSTLKKYSTQSLPEFASLKEAKEALSLINQAKNLLLTKKNEIAKKLQSLKQAKSYNSSYNKNSSFEFKA